MVALPPVSLRPHSRHAGTTLAGRFLGHSAVTQVILDEIRNERKGRIVGEILPDINVIILIQDLFIKMIKKTKKKTSKFLDLRPTTPKHEMFYHFKSHLSM